MRFCRSCYAVLEDQQTICQACGTRMLKRNSSDTSALETPRTQPSPTPDHVEERELTRENKSPDIPEKINGAQGLIRRASWPRLPTLSLREFRSQFFSFMPVIGLVVLVVCLLGQYTMPTSVQVNFLDDKYYKLILVELHVHPSNYYSIAVDLYHKMYAPTLAIIHFPLIFYIWLLAPTIDDVKWLYLVFAVAASVASYFTVLRMTQWRPLAFLCAVWIAYFLESPWYFMFEYWAIPVFLVGLAFFVSERNLPAAVIIGVATLIKEIFIPFMLIASIIYMLQWIFLRLRKRSTVTCVRRAVVWCIATIIVGAAYSINAIVSAGATSPYNFLETFDPSILLSLFAVYWFRYPPIPIILALSFSLIGMTALTKWSQRIIIYGSFVSMILLMLTVGESFFVSREELLQSSPRYIAMSITLINIFWLVGIYKTVEWTAKVLLRRVSQQQPPDQTSYSSL